MASISLTTLVPPIAVSATVLGYCAEDDTGNVEAFCYIGYDGTNSLVYLIGYFGENGSIDNTLKDTQTFELPMATAQTAYYKVGNAALDFSLYVYGYTIP